MPRKTSPNLQSPIPNLYLYLSPPCTRSANQYATIRTHTITDTPPEVGDNCFLEKSIFTTLDLLDPLDPVDPLDPLITLMQRTNLLLQFDQNWTDK